MCSSDLHRAPGDRRAHVAVETGEGLEARERELRGPHPRPLLHDDDARSRDRELARDGRARGTAADDQYVRFLYLF
mgnify:CR=1 FL=1